MITVEKTTLEKGANPTDLIFLAKKKKAKKITKPVVKPGNKKGGK